MGRSNKGYYLKTSNYVTVETLALLQTRLGFEAADLWSRDILDIVETLWIDKVLHNLAFEIWFSLWIRLIPKYFSRSFFKTLLSITAAPVFPDLPKEPAS